MLARLLTSFGGFESDLFNGAFSGSLVYVAHERGDAWLHVHYPTAGSGGYAIRNFDTAFSNLSSSETGLAKMRFRFAIDELPSAAIYVGGFGTLTVECRALMRLSTTGTFYANANGTLSSESAAALSVGVEYLVEIETSITNNPSGSDSQTTTVTVKSSDGLTTIGSVTATFNSSFFANPVINAPFLGSPSLDASASKRLRYRDWFVIAGDDPDTASVVLPTATRIECVPVTGQGASADWTGSYNLVRERPRDTATGEQTTTADEATTTFTHATAAALGIEGIEAVQVVAHLKAASSGAEALMLDGTEHAVTAPTSYSASGAVKALDVTAWTTARFDAAEFGARNKRGVSTQLSKIYLDVLHAGAGPAARAHSWKHKIVTYTGDGSYQRISGVGFHPSKILIKKLAGSNSAGAFWCEELGGTQSKVLSSATIASTAIMGAHADGFDLGPDAAVNQSGIAYVALCIDDGGTDGDGFFVKSGVYVGDALDNRDIVAGITPSAVIVFGRTAAILRTADMVGDLSVRLGSSTTTTNAIQALNADGFEIGTDSEVNQNLQVNPWLAITAAAAIEAFFAYGSFAGTGAIVQVTGIPFTPEFGFADTPSANDGAWRSTLVHAAGTDSTSWTTSGTGTTANGLRAFGAGSIDFGTQISVSGQTAYWIAFNLEGEVLDPTEIEYGPSLSGETIGLHWLHFFDAAGTEHVWSKITLPDPADYYGGRKKGIVLRWGAVKRGLSDRAGQFEGTTWSVLLADIDRTLRGLLAGLTTKFFTGRNLIMRTIADADRRARLVPRTVVRGVVQDYAALSPRHFEIKGQDYFAAKFTVGNSDLQIPRRTIGATDFPNAPTAAIGRPVPIVYGELSDLFEPDVPPGLASPSVTATVVGAAGSETYRFAITALDNRNGQAFNFDKRNDHAGETAPTIVTVTNAPSWSELSGSRYIHFDINAPGAHHCRAYFDEGTGGEFSLLDQTDEIGGGFHFYDYGQRNGVRDVDSVKRDCHPPAATNVVLDEGTGLVPVVYVGLRSVDGADRHEFLVCGHALKAILGVYQAGIRLDDATVAADFLIPGTAEWTAAVGADVFRDFNGRRYTVIYATSGTSRGDKAASGEEPITLNVQGIEDAGDGTGDLITAIALQYRHALQNWLIGDYQSGAWLASPTMPDDPELSQLDEASFDAVAEIHADRLEGGYPGAFMLGGRNDFLSLRNAIAEFNVNGDCYSGFNRKTQFAIKAISESLELLENAREFTQATDIFDGSFSTPDFVSEMFNVVPYAFARDYRTNAAAEFLENPDPKRSEDSIDNYEVERTAQKVQLKMIRDAEVAADIASRRLYRTEDPPRLVIFETGLRGLNVELGDVIAVTHEDGIGEDGWTRRPVFVIRHEFDPETFKVRIEGYDVAFVFAGGFILGDEDTLPDLWEDANADERAYGYLCDEDTDLFADGVEGKELL